MFRIKAERSSIGHLKFIDAAADTESIRALAAVKSQICIHKGSFFLQIYTDWANHYLEKSRSKRHISDLQSDVTDGVILGDVIEAVSEC